MPRKCIARERSSPRCRLSILASFHLNGLGSSQFLTSRSPISTDSAATRFLAPAKILASVLPMMEVVVEVADLRTYELARLIVSLVS